MAVTIGTNIASIRTQRQLEQSSGKLTSAYERLASGLRINRASDDAAGLAISTSLETRSRVFTQALRNISDAVSVVQIASDAVTQLAEIVTRQRELAEQARTVRTEQSSGGPFTKKLLH